VTDVADRITASLIREFRTAAQDGGVKVIAATTMSSLVAALAARRLGVPDLAISTGFGTLDARPYPALTLGETALGSAASPRGPISDTFIAVAKGMVGVVVSPAQLDAAGATNLSRIGGSNDAPKVALPGSRGLPDNNDSPSRVWYLLAVHTPRQLVEKVDFVSGPPPAPGRVRRLLTPLGIFELDPGSGWRATHLMPGVDSVQVAEATGFFVAVENPLEVPAPDDDEREVLAVVDPQNLRELEFLGRAEMGERFAEVAAAESKRREQGHV
jgi:glutaconate CoA-transferase subunit B